MLPISISFAPLKLTIMHPPFLCLSRGLSVCRAHVLVMLANSDLIIEGMRICRALFWGFSLAIAF
jgi:hypothetical protein